MIRWFCRQLSIHDGSPTGAHHFSSIYFSGFLFNFPYFITTIKTVQESERMFNEVVCQYYVCCDTFYSYAIFFFICDKLRRTGSRRQQSCR